MDDAKGLGVPNLVARLELRDERNPFAKVGAHPRYLRGLLADAAAKMPRW